MPPRNEAELRTKQEARAAKQKAIKAKPGADPNNPHVFNDGSIIADGVRIHRGAWAECTKCGGRIYFIKVGNYCVSCGPLRAEEERAAASIPAEIAVGTTPADTMALS